MAQNQILAATYSFTDTYASIVGPGGNFQIGGPDTASAEGGFTITWGEENNSQAIGADGAVMNSMHAARAGTCVFRLQKTSPINYLLSNMWNFQRSIGSIGWGYNVIAIRQLAIGDVYNLAGCAFMRPATNTYAKVGGDLEWEFQVGDIDMRLGPGVSYLLAQGLSLTG